MMRGLVYFGSFTAWYQDCDIVAIEQNLIQLGDTAALGCVLKLGHVLDDHIYKVVKPQQGAHDLLVVPHDYMDARTNTFVDELKWQQLRRIGECCIL